MYVQLDQQMTEQKRIPNPTPISVLVPSVPYAPEQVASMSTSTTTTTIAAAVRTTKFEEIGLRLRSIVKPRIRYIQSLWPGLSIVTQGSRRFGATMSRMVGSLIETIDRFFRPGRYTTYRNVPLTLETTRLLSRVTRKTLVLDLDETLVHSCYNSSETTHIEGCRFVPLTKKPDLIIDVDFDNLPVTFQVFKRPHVDLFLEFVGRWYNVVIYTASLEIYASRVLDKLDAGRGIFQQRLYRQHCRNLENIFYKDLNVISRDMRSIFIIDNSPNVYRDFPENGITIKTWYSDPKDTELLKLLPFLDALRFTKDVRSILARRIS